MSINTMLLPPRFPQSSPAASPSSSSSVGDFSLATASSLPDIIRTPRVLILDIRPHSAYSTARLPHAISLSVPSTLLKRPAFTLQKLTTMLSSSTARSRFSAWDKASRILAYDADSAALHDGSNLLGLLRKFRAEGFTGDIAWLQGGIQALWRDHRHLVEECSVSDDDDETEEPRFIRARDLPLAAFQQSTITSVHGRTQTNVSPTPNFSSAFARAPVLTVQPSRPPSTRAAANPFYDNIRQNIELSQGITERIPLRLSPTVASRVRELPFAWLRDVVTTAGRDEGTEALAMQFYRIELGEQRRMQGVMAHHSTQGSDTVDVKEGEVRITEDVQNDAPFPFSILAGIEKGAKNRYRNIWPFEHSRVRLQDQVKDDYVNASFVQPLGTRRQYIATQGPLPSTYSDFWSVVWEQNVSVVVMLTKEYEGGAIKCGRYWTDGQYGPFRLKCISTSGAKEEDDPGGGFFNTAALVAKAKEDASEEDKFNHTIRRVFELSHLGYPERKPRVINHLQYLGWPDMDVPVRPAGVLRLMFEIDDLVDKANENGASPALLHCSAGVGRTGAFIMLDAVLDGVRREIRKHVEARKAASSQTTSDSDSEAQNGSADAMDVDSMTSSRIRSLASSDPISDPVVPDSPKVSNSFSTRLPLSAQAHQTPPVTQTQSGPVATLHLGGDNSRRADIHVPLVLPAASAAQLQTPRSSQVKELAPASPASRTQSPPRTTAASSRPAFTPRSSATRQRPSLYARRVLISDFSIADADSMFTSPSPNPAFAMDVESLQPPSHPGVSSSSSGEGNMSSGERGSSGSGSGSSSSGHLTRPLQMAFAKMSSDDVPGPSGRCSDSDSFSPPAVSPRARAGSVSGSGSGSGEGANASGSGASVAAGGYSSASSLGLRGFAGLGVSSPVPSSGHSSPSSAPNGARPHQHRKLSMQKPSLLAPKPMHPLPPSVPDLTEEPERGIHATPALPPRLKPEKHHSTSSVRSVLSSSSSVPSSITSNLSSLLSSHPTDSSVTPLSTHDASPSPSPDKAEKKESEQNVPGDTTLSYTSPRKMRADDSPPLLSSFEEPIRQILEDMREQRMSLCQSLRQYVFVHNAVIEGALRIVDEERRRAGLEDGDLLDIDPAAIASVAPKMQTTGKRGASPTELLKKDKKGEVALAKRPSVKRGKSISSGESTGSG
ncbi:hypothetical protein DFH11DRAFT_1655328 [Phellopilus nigrolimitatus]|nr:hypothetical protein DFH11DRAFT_1655328 [Phellopilus nigrolimitatus]